MRTLLTASVGCKLGLRWLQWLRQLLLQLLLLRLLKLQLLLLLLLLLLSLWHLLLLQLSCWHRCGAGLTHSRAAKDPVVVGSASRNDACTCTAGSTSDTGNSA